MGRLPVFVLALCAAIAAAATSAAEMSESKQQLVREILELSSGPHASEQMAEVYLTQLHDVFGSLVDRLVASETKLSPEQKQKLHGQLADFDRFAGSFRSRFSKSIDLRSIREQVYLPLYDRYFDEKELRELVAFYRTPAGRKAIRVMPEILQQGTLDTRRLIEPRVMALVGEILAQERQKVLPEAPDVRQPRE